MERRLLAPALSGHIGKKINVSTLTGTKPDSIVFAPQPRVIWHQAIYNGATLLRYNPENHAMTIRSATGTIQDIQPLEVWEDC